MDLGLYIAASGMAAQQARESQVANNLANSATPGYKSSESTQHSFGALLLTNSLTGASIGSIDAGVQSGKAYTDLSAAAVRETGQPLDFAISGEGFFAVRTSAGVRYTRDGQFSVSAAGLLTDSFGNDVLSQSGATIKVPANRHLEVGALGLYKVTGAEKQGENLFNGTAAGKASGLVKAGALEESGVNPVDAMVQMTVSMHTFQSGQQAIAAIGQTMQEAASKVGSVSGN